MSESLNGQRMPMLSSAGTSGTMLQGPDAPPPVKSCCEPDKSARKGMALKAEHLAGTVKDKANAAVVEVGETMSGMAESLREHSPASVAPYTGKAADGLQQAGSYLQRGTVDGIVADVTGFMSRHPVSVMLTGVALGFMLARKLQK